jgi:hypothetical protein
VHVSYTPTARDVLHAEAVNLATDVTTMLLEYREVVGPEEAFSVATGILGLSERILKARASVTGEKAREHFYEARLLCQRTMVALERLAARCRIPLVRSTDLHERLSALAGAMGALGERSVR